MLKVSHQEVYDCIVVGNFETKVGIAYIVCVCFSEMSGV